MMKTILGEDGVKLLQEVGEGNYIDLSLTHTNEETDAMKESVNNTADKVITKLNGFLTRIMYR